MAAKVSREGENKPSPASGGEKVVSSYRSGWAYSEYAFQYGAAIIVCTLLGWWIDSQFKTNPIFLIIGVFAGASAGFLGLLKSLKVFGFKKKDERNKKV